MTHEQYLEVQRVIYNRLWDLLVASRAYDEGGKIQAQFTDILLIDICEKLGYDVTQEHLTPLGGPRM